MSISSSDSDSSNYSDNNSDTYYDNSDTNSRILYNVKNEYQDLSSDEIKNQYSSMANNHAVACLNLTSDTNIGLIIRTSSLFEIGKVFVMGRRRYDKRSSVGTHHMIPIERYPCAIGVHNEFLDIDKVTQKLVELSQTYCIVFIEQTSSAISIYDFKKHISFTKPILFVVGTESEGIPIEVLNNPKIMGLCVYIPQGGVGRSHNVSIALGIVLYEFFRLGK